MGCSILSNLYLILILKEDGCGKEKTFKIFRERPVCQSAIIEQLAHAPGRHVLKHVPKWSILVVGCKRMGGVGLRG